MFEHEPSPCLIPYHISSPTVNTNNFNISQPLVKDYEELRKDGKLGSIDWSSFQKQGLKGKDFIMRMTVPGQRASWFEGMAHSKSCLMLLTLQHTQNPPSEFIETQIPGLKAQFSGSGVGGARDSQSLTQSCGS